AVHPSVSLEPVALDLSCAIRAFDLLVGRNCVAVASVHSRRTGWLGECRGDCRVFVAGRTSADGLSARPPDVPAGLSERPQEHTHCLNPQTRGFELGSNSIVPNPFPCDKERVEFPICLRHEIETSLPFGLLYSPLLSPVAGARGVSRRYCRARGDA